MSLMDTIMGQLAGGGGMDEISRQLGVDKEKAAPATGAALTTLLGALARNAQQPGGADALANALERDHDGSLLENLGGMLGQAKQQHGGGILKHVLGGKRQNVERNLGKATGIDQGNMGQLMEMLAPVVMGALGKEKRKQRLDPGSLASMLGNERATMQRAEPKGAGMLDRLLDTDGDGDFDISDMTKHGAGLLGKFLGR